MAGEPWGTKGSHRTFDPKGGGPWGAPGKSQGSIGHSVQHVHNLGGVCNLMRSSCLVIPFTFLKIHAPASHKWHILWQLQCPLPSSKPATSQKRAADVPQVASSDINKTFDSAVDRPLADVETRFLAKQSASIGDLRAWEKHNAPARTASSRRSSSYGATHGSPSRHI